jgi:hypothetical protein
VLQLILVLLLGGAQRAAVQPPQAKPSWDEEDRIKNRRGPVILEKSEGGDPRQWRVRLKDRTLVETEGDELGLWEWFEGDDGYDYAIVQKSTGGIACPYQFRVVEIDPRGGARVSDEFGSCLQPSKTRLYGNALVLEMPPHVPHPDLLTPQENQQRGRAVEIYTVKRGKITNRTEIRR